MAGERDEALHRRHVRAISLASFRKTTQNGPSYPTNAQVDFVVGNPDGRVRTALAVFFVPAAGRPFPSDPGYQGMFVAGNQHTLSVMARETPNEQGPGLLFCDQVFGSLSTPVGMPGDTFGWLISDEADAREWYCRLNTSVIDEVAKGASGEWVARVTLTSRVVMTAEEWRRVADQTYLRPVVEGQPPIVGFLVGD
jgi:hypothetical protein